MTLTSAVAGRRLHITVPASSAGTVPRRPGTSPQDPPIYRAMMRNWAERGRTLPGCHDPEWARLATPPHEADPFTAPADPYGPGTVLSASRDPRGDGR
ncbi:hypothetical protein GCM10010365_30360 [Streptomyces poonensis]|uniref:Uncharacterized protein n=1 Tax=Streptomyces poonensis TaxID=68255 RepID=A0A918PHX2_9ACTN|nr:hypothetical protein [Streptomyces poonensis]GGZ08946.1 hypothetical protein GCM10010365_30360 [Streptomyces poonensis]GLJ90475.1 hypothetical protein GCM10017589_30780 [Streptomyces poonensis]